MWLIVALRVVTATHGAPAGIVWNNCVTGAVTLLLGLAAMELTVGVSRTRRPHR
ncbi:hypothetical protein [Streptomyces sp. NPDC047028]|uniref:hypothetical protein n=1 Tax=Streptomyces sp. NPDC047028 TaxID=3155793 RepID=UPI0033EAA007